MPRRSDARRVALQMLYLIDQNPDADVRRIQEEITEQLRKDELVDFAWDLFRGVREVRDQLDDMIVSVAQNWRLDRMAPTDRNVLRLAIYEMHHMGTPVPVVLDEAIEVAREFGGQNSPGFVNGILDKLIPGQPQI
ncbi:MAG: transcription antitermination factor NusB [Planctomycetaceae bacterium]